MRLRLLRDALEWLSDAMRSGVDAIDGWNGKRAARRYEQAAQRRAEAAAADDLLHKAVEDRRWSELSAAAKDTLLRKPKPNHTTQYLREMKMHPYLRTEDN